MITDWEQLIEDVEQVSSISHFSATFQLANTNFSATRTVVVPEGTRLTLLGPAALVDCNHQPYFKVMPNASLKLDALNIANCEISAISKIDLLGEISEGVLGGAVFNEGNFTAHNCMFFNNTARLENTKCSDGCKSSGGAICSIEGVISLDSCVFESNTVTHVTNFQHTRQTINAAGGAIALYNTAADFKHCHFLSNSANVSDFTSKKQHIYATQKAQGGAVYSTHSLFGKMTNCHFHSNTAFAKGPFPLSFGGAVTSFQDSTGSDLENCSFTSNAAVATSTQPEEGFEQAQGKHCQFLDLYTNFNSLSLSSDQVVWLFVYKEEDTTATAHRHLLSLPLFLCP